MSSGEIVGLAEERGVGVVGGGSAYCRSPHDGSFTVAGGGVDLGTGHVPLPHRTEDEGEEEILFRFPGSWRKGFFFRGVASRRRSFTSPSPCKTTEAGLLQAERTKRQCKKVLTCQAKIFQKLF